MEENSGKCLSISSEIIKVRDSGPGYPLERQKDCHRINHHLITGCHRNSVSHIIKEPKESATAICILQWIFAHPNAPG